MLVEQQWPSILTVMKLDRWVVYGNCLCGYIFDHPGFSSGIRVLTEAVRFIDTNNMQAECLDGKYKLGDPGTIEEHNQELIGRKPESKLQEFDNKIFLNPRG